ncbi:high-potential iron-sulfur protein [Granulosicoccus antarcticus]|uniref:High-potential iron-sulfur protein n=1 Tax=Granulosicoccus antarcticus IMCC3135 TaxID=1192854 RepID=A0A2Z2NLG3_9GAMM|nr:high-potential iron-sulfur protein [Granulosicoccus antarcticus]ASJ72292.1 High-potential iron-sulfur protein [Granulosicoccus antarcticus IMCC3135]
MTDIKRRKFVSLMGVSAAVIPVSALVASLPSRADDTPAVDPESAQAQALQYVAVSEKADQSCGTCTLYTGAADSEMGPCPLFPGSAVHSAGWCSAFVPKA